MIFMVLLSGFLLICLTSLHELHCFSICFCASSRRSELFSSRLQVFLKEPIKDRFVVRENAMKILKCYHSLENMKRIRWDFISTHNNNRENIYDSRSEKIVIPGFNVSCGKNYCNLKLIRTRKEDSGIYICMILNMEGIETNNSFVLTEVITEIELVVRGPIKINKIINTGDSVVLPCDHNISDMTRIRWDHISTHGQKTESLYHKTTNKLKDGNYEALCAPHQLSCNLKIVQVSKESAGKYICMIGDSLEHERKYGLDELTDFIEIELAVGELNCNTNIDKDVLLLGENDCYGLEPDVLNLQCSLSFYGNTEAKLLQPKWIDNHKFKSFESKSIQSELSFNDENGNKVISIQSSLVVSHDMVNSTFQCISDDTRPCQLRDFHIMYAKNSTIRLQALNSHEVHDIKCLANTSENVHCSYYWIHKDYGAILEKPHLLLPGAYTCIAKCHIGNNKECNIKAMEIEIIPASNLGSNVAILCSSGLIALLVTVFVLTLRFLYKRSIGKASNLNNENEETIPSENDEKKCLAITDINQSATTSAPRNKCIIK